MNDAVVVPSMSPEQARQLSTGCLRDPFSVLGPFASETGRYVRTFLPGALGVEVVARDGGRQLGTLSPAKPDGAHLYFCTASGTDARAQYTAEGMAVLKGSKARGQVTDSFKDKGFHVLRKQLEAEGILKPTGDQLVFTQDYLFKSPSAAAAIVVGNNMNGWLTWKNEAGKTLDDAVRQTAG